MRVADLPAIQASSLQDLPDCLRQLALLHAVQVQGLVCAAAVRQQDGIPLGKGSARATETMAEHQWNPRRCMCPS